MKFGEAIFKILSEGSVGSTLYHLDGNAFRIYHLAPVIANQTAITPFIAYAIQSNTVEYVKTGTYRNFEELTFTLDCVADTYIAAEAMANLARADCEGTRNKTVVNIYVTAMWLISETDNFDVNVEKFVKTLTFKSMIEW